MGSNIGVRTDGQWAGGARSRDYQIAGIGRFTYPWCSAGTLRGPELRYDLVKTKLSESEAEAEG